MIKIEDLLHLPTPLQKWLHPIFEQKELKVWIKRDDLIHPILSGNKFRKLKYNLLDAQKLGFDTLLSFAGAYSNHLYAMAGVSKYTDFKVKMIIRGDELNALSSPTLAFAKANGVSLIFVDRQRYRDKSELAKLYGKGSFIIPEGGSNQMALAGLAEMVEELLVQKKPDFIIASMGTGGTIAGILSNKNFTGTTIGVSSLKGGSFLKNEVTALLGEETPFELWLDYSFGGYGKYNKQLLSFIEQVEKNDNIPLEHVYTGKMLFGVIEKALAGYFPKGSEIIVYHSGGLQGKLKP